MSCGALLQHLFLQQEIIDLIKIAAKQPRLNIPFIETMVYPEDNTGIAGLSFDESDLLQDSTDLHAKILRETSLKYGKTATYIIPPSKLDGRGPYELTIPSMDTEW